MQTKPHHILIVDDEELFAEAVAKALTSTFGYHATAVNTGRAAVDLLKTGGFDVVLLDYKMPEMSGLNVLQSMHEEKMETPVVMLTGAGSEDIAVEAMKLGAYDYVRKEQVDIEHLPVLLNSVYERYLFRKEKERLEKEKLEIEKRAAVIGMFHTTVVSIAQYITNALTFLEMQEMNQEYALMQFVPAESVKRVEKSFADLHTKFRIIATGITALTGFSDVISRTPGVEVEMSKLRGDIQKTLADLQKLSSTIVSNQ